MKKMEKLESKHTSPQQDTTVMEIDFQHELVLLQARLKALEKKNGNWQTPAQFMEDYRLEIRNKADEVNKTIELLDSSQKLRNCFKILFESTNPVYENVPEYPHASFIAGKLNQQFTYSLDDSYQLVDALYEALKQLGYLELFSTYKILYFHTKDIR